MFDPLFQIGLEEVLSEEDRAVGLTEMQAKKVLAEFLQMLGREVYPNCEAAVNRYPIMDAVLVQSLRRMVKGETAVEAIFRALAEEFGLTVTLFGDCFKFEDSDIFCYVPSNLSHIYLAFMDSSFVQPVPPPNTHFTTLDPIE